MYTYVYTLILWGYSLQESCKKIVEIGLRLLKLMNIR